MGGFDLSGIDEVPVSSAKDITWNHTRGELQEWYDAEKKKQEEARAKKRADFNPRVKKWIESYGWDASRVDHYDSGTKRSSDLLSIYDWLGFGDGETIAVQVTDKGDTSVRIKKILGSVGYKWAKRAGWLTLVLGFEKGVHGAKVFWLCPDCDSDRVIQDGRVLKCPSCGWGRGL